MRRLRALVGLFQRSFPCAEFASLRSQAKDLAAALGAARDWDVFLALVETGPAAAFPGEPGFADIMAQARQRQDAGYTALRALMAGPVATGFVLSAQAFIARRGWRNTGADGILPRLAMPAKDFARESLGRMHGKLLKRVKKFDELSTDARHELRKDLKKLRYAADMFGLLFERPGQMKAYLETVAALQDELGLFNDLIAAEVLARALDAADGPAANQAVGIIRGWCGHGAQGDAKALTKRLKQFRRAKPFG